MAVRAGNNKCISKQLFAALTELEDFLHESGHEEITITRKCNAGTPGFWSFDEHQTTTEMIV